MKAVRTIRLLWLVGITTASGCFWIKEDATKGGSTAEHEDCPDDGEDCDSAAPSDADEDGYTSDEDCDDSDGTIHPDATETCNGIDDNCDGAVDEAVTVAGFIDADGDGVGSTPTTGCEGDEGFSLVDGDCNDADAGVHPGAAEVWYDDIDQDCDGNDTDRDGDGFSGHPDTGADCDDEDPSVHPEAAEVCDNRVDEDCSGTDAPCVVDGVMYGDAADAVWVDESWEYSHTGEVLHMGGDLTSDGHPELLIAAPRYEASNTLPGRIWVVPTPLDLSTDTLHPLDVDGSTTADGAILIEGDQGADGIGRSDIWARTDFDGDGYTDLLVSAPHWEDNGTASGTYLDFTDDAGRLLLFEGPLSDRHSGTLPDYTPADADLIIVGEEGGPYLGSGLSGVGNVDGGSGEDLYVRGYATGGMEGSGSYLFLDIDTRLSERSLELADADILVEDLALVITHLGDLNDDGQADLLLHTGDTFYAFHGPLSAQAAGVLAPSDADRQVVLPGRTYSGGVAVDHDGDGADELFICDSFNTVGGVEGAGHCLLIDRTVFDEGDDVTLTGASVEVLAQLIGTEDGLRFGYRGASSGDTDGDGTIDVLVASELMGDGAGSTWLFRGPLAGTRDADSADATILGDPEPSTQCCSGRAILGADLDHDGYSELLTSGSHWDFPEESNGGGSVRAFRGGPVAE